LLSRFKLQRSESPLPCLIEALGFKAQRRGLKVVSERRVKQNGGLMHKPNTRCQVWTSGDMVAKSVLLKARQRISGGRAAKQVGLISGSLRDAQGRHRTGKLATFPDAEQKSAQGTVAMQAGKAGWSQVPNGASECAQASSWTDTRVVL
jgi:hypothetical protein